MIRFLNSWITWGVCFALCLLSTFCAALFGADNKGREVLPFPALEVIQMPVFTDAISDAERTFIIHQLAETGKWEGRRNGAEISIARLNPLMFHFAVTVS